MISKTFLFETKKIVENFENTRKNIKYRHSNRFKYSRTISKANIWLKINTHTHTYTYRHMHA